jgi:hypothetical protein
MSITERLKGAHDMKKLQVEGAKKKKEHQA